MKAFAFLLLLAAAGHGATRAKPATSQRRRETVVIPTGKCTAAAQELLAAVAQVTPRPAYWAIYAVCTATEFERIRKAADVPTTIAFTNRESKTTWVNLQRVDEERRDHPGFAKLVIEHEAKHLLCDCSLGE
jgi:hypothetical protein